jgi:hypothetical protein
LDTELLTDVDVIEGYEGRLSSFQSVVQALSQPPEVSAERAVWLASTATDGKTGLIVRELSTGKVLGRFMRMGIARLLRRPDRDVSVRIHSVPGEFSEKVD